MHCLYLRISSSLYALLACAYVKFVFQYKESKVHSKAHGGFILYAYFISTMQIFYFVLSLLCYKKSRCLNLWLMMTRGSWCRTSESKSGIETIDILLSIIGLGLLQYYTFWIANWALCYFFYRPVSRSMALKDSAFQVRATLVACSLGEPMNFLNNKCTLPML